MTYEVSQLMGAWRINAIQPVLSASPVEEDIDESEPIEENVEEIELPEEEELVDGEALP